VWHNRAVVPAHLPPDHAEPTAEKPPANRLTGCRAGRPHLGAALVAILLVAAALAAGALAAHRIEGTYIHALAPGQFDQKQQGRALQAEAFRQPDLLLLYGSSELIRETPYRATQFFGEYPTGFAIFPVGGKGDTPLIYLQELAAVGADLRGKELAISLLPSAIVFHTADRADYYAGNFSRLHAGELAFSTDLSSDLKRGAARRMLDFPETLASDPLLRFALDRLADPSPLGRAQYWAVLPLGKLHNLVLRLQDHWETVAYIRRQPNLDPTVPRRPARLDWSSLLVRSQREAERQAGSNPAGFSKRLRRHPIGTWKVMANIRSGRAFLRDIETATGWTDLELLLRTLNELGARPLLLSPPLEGAFFDFWGVPSRPRQAYYDRLRDTAGRYGVPLRDFADHDGDPHFVVDFRSHLSPQGWAYYDQTLDAFYHGALP
jgi:D-alanine transfer protein